MAAIQAAGVPAAISWPQGMLKRDCWAVPKGSPNKANAMKFIGFGTMAISQARLSSLIPYGSVNNESDQYIAPKQMEVLPSSRRHQAEAGAVRLRLVGGQPRCSDRQVEQVGVGLRRWMAPA